MQDIGALSAKSPHDDEPLHDRAVVGVFVQNDLIRQGLKAVLATVGRVAAVRLSGDPVEAGRLLQSGADVMIVSPAEQSWLASLPADRDRSRTRILLLLNEGHLRNLESVPLSSVDGTLLQDELSPQVLDDALYRLGIGQTPMPSQVAHQLIARIGNGSALPTVRPAALTSRERETLDLLAEGLSNKQIARALGVSSHGAKRLVGSVLMKLGAPNRTAAVVNAIKVGLVQPT